MKYEVMSGFETKEKRYEAGEVIDESVIPSKSKKWLIEQGIVIKYIEKKKKRARNEDGSFKKDDKSTPDINEAWVEEGK
tara:strand:+ start:144 stop:380 length:237 start_codon:yes stop_codon:yes gene_type:complete